MTEIPAQAKIGWGVLLGVLALPIGIGVGWTWLASTLFNSQNASLSGVAAGAIVAVLELGVGIRNLTTGIANDLIDIEKKRLEIERVRLELEQKLPRELAKLSLEVANLRQEAFQASPEEIERLKGDFLGTIRDNAARWQGPEKPRS